MKLLNYNQISVRNQVSFVSIKWIKARFPVIVCNYNYLTLEYLTKFYVMFYYLIKLLSKILIFSQVYEIWSCLVLQNFWMEIFSAPTILNFEYTGLLLRNKLYLYIYLGKLKSRYYKNVTFKVCTYVLNNRKFTKILIKLVFFGCIGIIPFMSK